MLSPAALVMAGAPAAPHLCFESAPPGPLARAPPPGAPPLFGTPPPRRAGRPTPPAYAAPHGDVLLAVDAVGDRVADDSRAQPPLPQHLAAVAIDRAEVTIQAAVE